MILGFSKPLAGSAPYRSTARFPRPGFKTYSIVPDSESRMLDPSQPHRPSGATERLENCPDTRINAGSTFRGFSKYPQFYPKTVLDGRRHGGCVNVGRRSPQPAAVTHCHTSVFKRIEPSISAASVQRNARFLYTSFVPSSLQIRPSLLDRAGGEVVRLSGGDNADHYDYAGLP